jgi:hypothetical protein
MRGAREILKKKWWLLPARQNILVQSPERPCFCHSGLFPGNCAFQDKSFPANRFSYFAIKSSQQVMI